MTEAKMVNMAKEPEWPEEEKIEEIPVEEEMKPKKKAKKEDESAIEEKIEEVKVVSKEAQTIDFVCPACKTKFKAEVSVKWKVYVCPKCKAEYNLRPSGPQPHGGREE